MARQVGLLSALAAIAVSASQAQPPSASPTPPTVPPAIQAMHAPGKPEKPHPAAPAVSQVPGWDPQAFMSTMTPEQRQKFLQNLERWKKLPPEQQAELRRNEAFRQRRVLAEISEAIAHSGLQLDPAGRQLFTLRYAQERRTIEEGLRKEMEEKRRKAVEGLVDRLVTEFRATPAKHPTPPAAPVPTKPSLSPTSAPTPRQTG